MGQSNCNLGVDKRLANVYIIGTMARKRIIRPINVMAKALRGPLFHKRVIAQKKRQAAKRACRGKV